MSSRRRWINVLAFRPENKKWRKKAQTDRGL
jgi:hypothetical protein